MCSEPEFIDLGMELSTDDMWGQVLPVKAFEIKVKCDAIDTEVETYNTLEVILAVNMKEYT